MCRDPEAAVELLVKRARAGSSSLAPDALLSMLLNPGEGRAPLLEDAVTLLDCVTGMAAAGSEVEAGGEEGKGGGGRAAANAANPSPRPPLLPFPPLDASSILSAMGDSTPLCEVSPLIRRLLRARVRGRRAATFAKALARAETTIMLMYSAR